MAMSWTQRRLTRRRVLAGSTALGAVLLAACAGQAAPTPSAPTAAPKAGAEVPAKPGPEGSPAPGAQSAGAKPPAAAEPTKPAAAQPRPEGTRPVPAGWTTGKVSADNGDPFFIISWEGKGKIEKWKTQIDAFFETFYPKMKLQFDWGLPWDSYWTKLQTTVTSGAPLDLCWMHDTRCPTFGQLGLLVPLDDHLKAYPPEAWPDKFYPSQVTAFRYKGRQYGFPYDWAPGAFYVNVDMLQAAGVEMPTESWTFDDLLKAAQKLTKNTGDPKTSQWGVILPNGSGNTYWVVRNFGGEQVVGDPPTSKFDDPNTVAAYQYIYDAIWKHKVMPNPEEMQVLGGGSWQAFASGKVGLVYALNDASNSVANAVGKRFKISAAPTPRGKAEKRAQFVGGSAFSIPKGSPHPDVAYELTRWVLANPENLPKIGSMAEGGTFVPRTDFWEHGLPPESTGISRDAFKKAFYDLGLRDGVYPNYFVGFLQWDPQVFNKNMSLLWAGQEKDVAKIMATVQKETVDLLKAQPQ